MESGYRLRIKLGEDEFEAEGTEKSVKDQFEQFKALREKSSPTTVGPGTTSSHKPLTKVVVDQRLNVLFENDEKRKLITLKKKPVGQQSSRDAVLLILLGFRLLRQENDVPVTLLSDALEQTGFKVDRVDRFTVPCTREQLVFTGGKGKGSRYTLTNSGLEKAHEAMEGLLSQIAK